MQIPIAFPKKSIPADAGPVLAVDVGGTKTDVGLFSYQHHELIITEERMYASREWESLTSILQDFLATTQANPNRLSIAVAGPVRNTTVKLTNLDWIIDVNSLSNNLNIREIRLLNDLKANAYGLAALYSTEFLQIHSSDAAQAGNAAIIAPGTGLGEAGMFWDGVALHPFASEGGHCDFAPRDKLDCELYGHFYKQYNHVSWERVISGPGIYNIYQFLRDVKRIPEPVALHEKFQQGADPAQVIGESAAEFVICQQSLELFTRYLAVESANLALKFNATGGLYIGGGIVPKIWNAQLQAIFLEQFVEVGRLRHLIEAVPVWIVLNSKTPLFGAAYYGLRS